jgi:hypothetical protein
MPCWFGALTDAVVGIDGIAIKKGAFRNPSCEGWFDERNGS